MSKHTRSRRDIRHPIWRIFRWSAIGLILGLLTIPLQISLTLHQVPIPQAIFVLGGDIDRMKFAAQFWQSHSNLDVWISDFAVYETENRQVFERSGVPKNQVKFDGRATDTVTNFTSLVSEFSRQKLRHLYLITSDYHLRRARAIAAIVLGSRGIVVTAIALPARIPRSESMTRVLRDGGRSLLWLATGHSGASLRDCLRNDQECWQRIW